MRRQQGKPKTDVDTGRVPLRSKREFEKGEKEENIQN